MSGNSSDSFRNVTKYLGQDYRFAPTYVRTRDPTPNDLKPKEQQGYYPISSFWTNTSNNKVFILVNFTTVNGQTQAIWDEFITGNKGPILDIGVPNGNSPIPPDSNGLINFTSTSGSVTITGSAGGLGAENINFDVSSTEFSINIISQTVAGSYTYTPSSVNMKYCIVEAIGGGGGGGGAGPTLSGFVSMGGGGGAGAYGRGFFSFAAANGQPFVVGAGGLAGANTGGTGGNGGSSSFGSTLIVSGGGQGGLGGTTSAFTSSSGGAGGTSSGTSLSFGTTGNPGGVGFGININTLVTGAGVSAIGFIIVSGYGSASVFGSGGEPQNGTGPASEPGNVGIYGSGGSGGLSNAGAGAIGGQGGAGLVIITEYILK